MSLITQIILSIALSLAVAAGFNPTVQSDIQQAVQGVDAAVTQTSNLTTQAISNLSANANVTVGSSANTQNSTSVPESSNSNGSVDLSSIWNGLFGQSSGSSGSTSNGSGGSSLLNLNLTHQSNTGLNLGLGQ